MSYRALRTHFHHPTHAGPLCGTLNVGGRYAKDGLATCLICLDFKKNGLAARNSDNPISQRGAPVVDLYKEKAMNSNNAGHAGMSAAELTVLGYRRISNKYRMVARIDRPDWVEHMAAQSHRTVADYFVTGDNSYPAASWGDYFRRVYSKDKLEGLPDAVFKAIPGGEDTRPSARAFVDPQMRLPVNPMTPLNGPVITADCVQKLITSGLVTHRFLPQAVLNIMRKRYHADAVCELNQTQLADLYAVVQDLAKGRLVMDAYDTGIWQALANDRAKHTAGEPKVQPGESVKPVVDAYKEPVEPFFTSDFLIKDAVAHGSKAFVPPRDVVVRSIRIEMNNPLDIHGSKQVADMMRSMNAKASFEFFGRSRFGASASPLYGAHSLQYSASPLSVDPANRLAFAMAPYCQRYPRFAKWRDDPQPKTNTKQVVKVGLANPRYDMATSSEIPEFDMRRAFNKAWRHGGLVRVEVGGAVTWTHMGCPRHSTTGRPMWTVSDTIVKDMLRRGLFKATALSEVTINPEPVPFDLWAVGTEVSVPKYGRGVITEVGPIWQCGGETKPRWVGVTPYDPVYSYQMRFDPINVKFVVSGLATHGV